MKLTERAAKQKINLIRRGLINLGISLRLDIKSEEYIELLNLALKYCNFRVKLALFFMLFLYYIN